MSNIYAANSVYTKFRSMGINEGEKVKEDNVEPLAKMEHARWNMEKLLVGFSALPKKDRDELNNPIRENTNPEAKKEAEEESKKNKKEKFKHKDIAPYDELPEDSRKYDKAIVRNLTDVINDL